MASELSMICSARNVTSIRNSLQLHSRNRLPDHRLRNNSRGCGCRIQLPKINASAASGVNHSPENGVIEVEFVEPSPPRAQQPKHLQLFEERFEKAILNCRFFTLFAVVGSMAGSLLCFFKGSTFIVTSFLEYFQHCFVDAHQGSGRVILLLVEAVDVYLVGTVMLIFGMGLYELFISTLEVPGGVCTPDTAARTAVCDSNLFGLFRLRERPKWLEIRSLDELKTKLGHVIVMVLLVGMFEKSKKIPVTSGVELLCFSISILFASCCLFLLSKLHTGTH